jgi:hypothetical protein
MERVRALLDGDEPDYEQAAQLGEEALPHLIHLVEGADVALASKAAYLAAFINAPQSANITEKAAQSEQPVVRVAAAGALTHIRPAPVQLMATMLSDQDAGVRYWTLRAIEVHRPAGLQTRVQAIAVNDPDVSVRQFANQIATKLP